MKTFIVASVLFFLPAIKAGETARMTIRTKTEMVVIHHSATVSGNVDIFQQYHKTKLGWADVGYHYVICNGKGGADGFAQKGREEKFVGAHAGNPKPSRNSNSIGICLVGADAFTVAQKQALVDLLADICKRYKIKPTATTIQGHHEKCPGTSLKLDQIINQVELRLKAPTTHRVQSGETLFSISRLYGQELFAKNRDQLVDPNLLPLGAILRLN